MANDGQQAGSASAGGSPIDEAETFIEDFTRSRIDIVPIVKGSLLFHKGEKSIKK